MLLVLLYSSVQPWWIQTDKRVGKWPSESESESMATADVLLYLFIYINQAKYYPDWLSDCLICKSISELWKLVWE